MVHRIAVRLLEIIAVAFGYFGASQLGLRMAYGHGMVSPDWITTGLAVAALALWGGRLWPGVALGSLIAYTNAGAPPLVGAGIALGNTIEALAGAWILRRWAVVGELGRIRDVAVVMASSFVAPLSSATGGVIGPWLDALLPWREVVPRWAVWWVGDATGILIFAPPLLAWFGTRSPGSHPSRPWETAAVLAVGGAAIAAAFIGEPLMRMIGVERVPIAPFVFPPMLWAAVRLPPRQAVLVPASMAIFAIWLTFYEIGPFFQSGAAIDLILAQLTFGAIIGTVLVVIGAVANLEEAVHRAEEVNLAKSRFVAAVRHDLAQPLQAIRLFLGALAPRIVFPQGKVLVERIAGSVEAMGSVLDALNDITAVECDLVKPEPAVFHLAELLEQLADECRPQAAEKGLHFRFVSCSCQVRTDRQLLGRMFRNLLSNAVRYTTHGRVLLGCRHTSGSVRVEVWDTGPGIPREEQEAIFEAFHRAPGADWQAPARRAQGLGLGLATVRSLARLLGLKVAVRSVVGKGSVFSVEMRRS